MMATPVARRARSLKTGSPELLQENAPPVPGTSAAPPNSSGKSLPQQCVLPVKALGAEDLTAHAAHSGCVPGFVAASTCHQAASPLTACTGSPLVLASGALAKGLASGARARSGAQPTKGTTWPPKLHILDDFFGLESQLEQHRVDRQTVRSDLALRARAPFHSPLSCCSTEAGYSQTGYGVTPSDGAYSCTGSFSLHDLATDDKENVQISLLVRSHCYQISCSDDKENVQPPTEIGNFGVATTEFQVVPMSIARVLPSEALLELELALGEPPAGGDHDTDIVVESDAEDVDPELWSEGLAEKLEARVRSNADGKYDFDFFEDV